MKKVFLPLWHVVLLCATHIAFGQWQSSDLPSFTKIDYSTFDVISTGSRIVAATSNGIYTSDNEGTQWVSRTSGLTNPNIYSLAYDGQVIIAGANNGQLFISTTNGDSWVEATSFAPGLGINHILLKGSKFYALTNYGLYSSDDHGLTWQTKSTNLPSALLINMCFKGEDLFITCGSGVIYKSADYGDNWSLANTGIPMAGVNAITTDGTKLWVGLGGYGVYTSLDNGSSWTSAWTGMALNTIVNIIYLPSGKLLASSQSGTLYVSTDGGLTWVNKGNLFTSSSITNSVIHNGSLFVSTLSSGLFKSTDDAVSWTQLNNGIEVTINKLFNIFGNIYASGSLSNYVSDNQAQTWTPVSNLPVSCRLFSTYTQGARTYIGTIQGLYYSDDSGVNWIKVTSPSLPASNFAVNAVDAVGSTLFLGTNYGVFSSTDGTTWTNVSSGLPSNDIYTLKAIGSKVFAINGFQLYESSDLGQSWILTTALASMTTTGVYTDGNNMFVFGQGLKKSSDGGISYTAINMPSSGMNIIDFKIHNGAYYAVGNRNDVYVSLDKGATWTTFSDGLPKGIYFMIKSIVFDQNEAIICTAGPFDVFHRPVPACPEISVISGLQNVCLNQTNNYFSVYEKPGASYLWSTDGGFTIASGQGTPAIYADAISAGTHQIKVVQSYPGCADLEENVDVVVTPLVIPTITGPTNVCENTIATYSIPAIKNAINQWTVPSNASIISGQGTPNIQVAWGDMDSGGDISLFVVANGCTANAENMKVTVDRAATINDVLGLRAVCSGQPNVAYKINDINAASTVYTWSVPSDFTLVSGQGTDEISVLPGTTSGTFTVQASNGCGTSELVPFDVAIGNLTALEIVGPAEVDDYAAGMSYGIIPAVPNVTYQWTVPGDATLYFGQGKNAIVVNWGTQSGDLTVTLTSTIGCGSVTSVLPVHVNQLIRPTASIRMASTCGGFLGEFYNLSGTFPLKVYVTDYTRDYEFILNSADDNIRVFPANKSYSILAVYDANGVRSLNSGVSGSITTSVANLTIDPSTSVTVSCGTSLQVYSTVFSDGAFEWFKLSTNGTYVSVGTESYLQVTSSGQYALTYVNPIDGCIMQSNLVNVTVENRVPAQPSIAPAGGINVACGQTINTTLTATAGYSYYTWYKDGNIINGATSNTYSAVSIGTYTVQTSYDNYCYSLKSQEAVINQIEKPFTPDINIHGSVSLYCGKPTELRVLNSYLFTEGYYRWYKDGVLIPGANLSLIAITENGFYTVEASREGICYSDRSPATLATIQNKTDLVLSSSTGSFNMACGATINLSTASGYTTYNWYKDGIALSEHSNQLTAVSLEGVYAVESVGDGCISTRAFKEVFVGYAPPLAVTPFYASATCGNTVTLSAEAGFSFYKWFKNGALIPNEFSVDLSVAATGDYTVRASMDGICYTLPSTPSHADLLLSGVTATINCVKPTIGCGEKAVLVAGPNVYTYYQWYRNGAMIDNTNTPQLETTIPGNYAVAVSNDNICYSLKSNTSVLVTVSTQSSAIQINNGSFTFAYEYNSGNNTLAQTGVNATNFDYYQWQYSLSESGPSWVDLIGETSKTLIMTKSSGVYRLRGLFAGCGASHSNTVRLSITGVPIEVSPAQSNAIMCRSLAKLTASAGHASYSWRNVTNNYVVAITTDAELLLSNYNQGSGTYRVTVSGVDPFGVEYVSTSANMVVQVLDDITPELNIPVLACAGTSGSITVATPTGNYANYEWKNSADQIVGQANQLLVTAGGIYTLNVTDFAGCTSSASVSVTALETTSDFTPVLATQSGALNYCSGSNTTVVISNLAALPSGSYIYKWYKNGVLLASGSSNTMTVNTDGMYSLQIVAQEGTQACIGYSNILDISMYPAIDVRVQGPVNNEFCSGAGQTLVAMSVPGYVYQWGQYSAIASPGGVEYIFNNIAGATAQTYAPTVTGLYGIKIRDINNCIANSDKITVSILPAPITPVVSLKNEYDNIIAAPSIITTCQALNLYASNGLSALGKIQWYKDGQAMVGETTSVLSISTAGNYALEFAEGICSKMSAPVQVVFSSLTPVVINYENAVAPSSITACQPFNLSVNGLNATGTLQWYKDGLVIEGETNSIIVVSTAGKYSLSYTEGLCSKRSTAVQVVFSPLPSAIVTFENTIAPAEGVFTLTSCSNAPATLVAPVGAYTYKWYQLDYPTQALSGLTPISNSLRCIPSLEGKYYAVQVTLGQCSVLSQAYQIVKVQVPTVAPSVSAVDRCKEGIVTLTAQGTLLPGWSYRWMEALSNTLVQESTSTSFTTPYLTESKVYNVSYANSSCSSTLATSVAANVKMPILPVTQDVSLCGKGKADLSINPLPSYSYNWYATSIEGKVIGTGSTYSTPNLNTSTRYYVQSVLTVNGGPCRSSLVSILVNVNTPAYVKVSKDVEICKGSNTSLTASGVEIYKWSVKGVQIGTGATLVVSPVITTTYEVEGLMLNGCSDRATVTVTVNPNPVLTVSSDIGFSICAGAKANFSVIGASKYKWYVGGNSTQISNKSSVSVTPTSNTNYVVIGVDKKGCQATKIFPVDVKAKPLPPTVSQVNICAGQNAVLSVNNPWLNTEYKWYDAKSKYVSSGTSLSVNAVSADETYFVEATDLSLASCVSDKATALVNVVEVVSPANSSLNICASTEAMISPSNLNAEYSYNWYSTATGGSPLVENSNIYVANLPGNGTLVYYLEASKIEAGITCVSSRRGEIRVTGLPLPNLVVSSDWTICENSKLQLHAYGASSYLWSTGSTRGYLDIIGTETTTFEVTGTGANGCSITHIGPTITVLPAPATPTLTSDVDAVCGNQSILFRASSIYPGNVYYWTIRDSYNNVIESGYNNEPRWMVLASSLRGYKMMVKVFDPSQIRRCVSLPATKIIPVRSYQALYFDGVDDKASFYLSTIVEDQSFSMAANVKLDVSQNHSSPVIVSKRDNNYGGLVLSTINNGKNLSLWINGSDYVSSSIPTLHDGLCHSVIVTVKTRRIGMLDTKQVSFYLDGSLVSSIRKTYSDFRTSGPGTIVVGNDYTGRPLKGEVHRITMWGYDLSAANASQYFSSGATNFWRPSVKDINFNFQDGNYDVTLGDYYFVEPNDPQFICGSYCFSNDRIASPDALVDNVEIETTEMLVQPNPFDLNTTVTFKGFSSASVELVLTDMNGNEIMRKQNHPVAETFELGQELKSGLYLLRAIGESEVQTIKIVKAK